jgi:hypothetical protein
LFVSLALAGGDDQGGLDLLDGLALRAMFPTAERRGRFHTDMARAWWLRSRPEQAAHQLLAAHGHAPAEVRDRPAIRNIAVERVDRHPRVPGARELAAVITPGGAPR